eukprot:m.126694 g.126694  ORF g.126694 m.126694 type:complete len:89 (-) comp14521_c0_seq4:1-267(-)
MGIKPGGTRVLMLATLSFGLQKQKKNKDVGGSENCRKFKEYQGAEVHSGKMVSKKSDCEKNKSSCCKCCLNLRAKRMRVMNFQGGWES